VVKSTIVTLSKGMLFSLLKGKTNNHMVMETDSTKGSPDRSLTTKGKPRGTSKGCGTNLRHRGQKEPGKRNAGWTVLSKKKTHT